MRFFSAFTFLLGSIVAFLMSLMRSNNVADRVPMHWNAAGQVDRYGSKWEAFLFLPIFMIFFAVVFGLVMAIGANRLREKTVKALNIVAVATVVFFLVIHKMILSGSPDQLPHAMPYLFSGLLIVMGYAMRGVEPNPFIGIRVPWTMNNPTVWRITHERASKLWITAGIVCLGLSVLNVPIMIPILVFTAVVLYPILDSYRISKAA